MKFDNKKSTYNIWVQKFITTVILFPLIVLFSFANYFKNPFLGIDRGFWVGFFVLLYTSVILYHRLRNPNYILFSDNGNKITLRYFPAKVFNQKKHSIEIPKSKFVKFEIISGRMFDSLILYQNFKNGVGKYPPISISALPKKDLNRLKRSLSQYIKK